MAARSDVFRIPTRISFGRGVALTVADPLRQVGATKVLLVTDKGVVKAGLVAPIEERLREAKIPYEIYDDVVPDPGVELANTPHVARERTGRAALRNVVAFGGTNAVLAFKTA